MLFRSIIAQLQHQIKLNSILKLKSSSAPLKRRRPQDWSLTFSNQGKLKLVQIQIHSKYNQLLNKNY